MTTHGLDTALPSRQMSMTLLMTPDMANFSGNVHGGIVLKLLDQVAYACASRYAGKYVVTLSVDQVMFRQPIHVGEMVTFLASVNYTGRTSMEVGIKVIAENIPGYTVSILSPGTDSLRAALQRLSSIVPVTESGASSFGSKFR